jgi:hypothetical protein
VRDHDQERGHIEATDTVATAMNAGGMIVKTDTDQVDEEAELQIVVDAVVIHLLLNVIAALVPALDDQEMMTIKVWILVL